MWLCHRLRMQVLTLPSSQIGLQLASRFSRPLSSCVPGSPSSPWHYCLRRQPQTAAVPVVRTAVSDLNMAEFDDEPASKRARLDLEDGAAEEAPQPSRERTIVAPPPSTSKALKSVLKGMPRRSSLRRTSASRQPWLTLLWVCIAFS